MISNLYLKREYPSTKDRIERKTFSCLLKDYNTIAHPFQRFYLVNLECSNDNIGI